MRPRKEGFVWGVAVAVLIICLSLFISPAYFKLLGLAESDITISTIFMYTVFTMIFGAITLDLVIVSYYIFHISKIKLNPKERIKELEIRLKSIEIGKLEARKRYYNRKIGKETFNKIMQDYEQDEIDTRSEVASLKSRE